MNKSTLDKEIKVIEEWKEKSKICFLLKDNKTCFFCMTWFAFLVIKIKTEND
jgi:hypothetical protein